MSKRMYLSNLNKLYFCEYSFHSRFVTTPDIKKGTRDHRKIEEIIKKTPPSNIRIGEITLKINNIRSEYSVKTDKLSGRIDAVVYLSNKIIVVEIKTLNDSKIREGYIRQLWGYSGVFKAQDKPLLPVYGAIMDIKDVDSLIDKNELKITWIDSKPFENNQIKAVQRDVNRIRYIFNNPDSARLGGQTCKICMNQCKERVYPYEQRKGST